MRKFVVLALSPWLVLAGLWVLVPDARPGQGEHSHDRAPMTTDELFEALRRQASITSSEWPDRKITQALPLRGREVGEIHDAAIAGEVIGIEPGAAYVNRDDAERATRVAFDSPEAQWKVFRVVVKPQWALEASTAGAEFGLVTSAETRAVDVESGLVGTDVLVLLEDPGWFQFDAELPNIGHSGELLGRVGDAGVLSFPVMEPHDSEAYLGGVTTLGELSGDVAQAR